MSRKVFISFLGTNNYVPCNYYSEILPNQKIENVQYVQEALIQLYCNNFNESDKFFFFLTDDAFKQNWKNDGQFNNENKKYDKKNIGLEQKLSELRDLGFVKSGIHFEPIKEGYSSEAIWEIFTTIYNLIENEDDIILDITHGFRSLPMLGIVLISYLKELKSIKVKGIHYGAFEVLGPVSKVLQMELKERNAPILDLLPLAELQQWTGAAREFLKNGNSSSLSELLLPYDSNLAASFEGFEKSISTCRGKSILIETDYFKLKSLVQTANDSMIGAQVKPLLEKIEKKIAAFDNSNILNNGLAAVDWCIEHNMIQQGITFLQETIHSWVIEKVVGKEYINELFFREMSAGALQGIYFKNNKNFIKDNQIIQPIHKDFENEFIEETYNSMRSIVSKELRKIYTELIGKDGFRNDINHCGFRSSPFSPIELKEKLNELNYRVKKQLL